MSDRSATRAIVVSGGGLDPNQTPMLLSLFDENGDPIEISNVDPNPNPGWQGLLEWQPYPLGSGWQDYMDVFPADNFGSPQFAVFGELVFLRGALYNNEGVPSHLGALPEAAQPFHKQRMLFNQSQSAISLDIGPDGLLKQGNGMPPNGPHIILSGFYTLTE